MSCWGFIIGFRQKSGTSFPLILQDSFRRGKKFHLIKNLKCLKIPKWTTHVSCFRCVFLFKKAERHKKKSLHMSQRRPSRRAEGVKGREIVSGWGTSNLPFSGHVLSHIKPVCLSIIRSLKRTLWAQFIDLHKGLYLNHLRQMRIYPPLGEEILPLKEIL